RDRCCLHCVGGSILGTSVGVDQDAALTEVVFDKSHQDGIDDALDCAAVVQGGDAHQNVYLTHRSELADELIGEKAVFAQRHSQGSLWLQAIADLRLLTCTRLTSRTVNRQSAIGKVTAS